MTQQRVMTGRERRAMEERMPPSDERVIPSGPAAAAVLAAGIGTLALGVLTTLAEASSAISQSLNLFNPVGPLAGKVFFAVVVWLVAWVVLHLMWKDRQVNFSSIFSTSLILIALGFLGTFPIFFDLFA